ncbi:MAG TPA: SBBP repeat-containing protein, partial [Pyrinomonadaceae bacterium]
MREAYGSLPLQFEANQGQADPRVGFVASGGGYDLFLTPVEAVFSFGEVGGAGRGADSVAPAARGRRGRETDVLRMRFVGARGAAKLEGRSMLPGKSNYFNGPDAARWITGIPNYARVNYLGIYDGVDATFYGNRRRLEYDFIVKPGADPSVIRLAFEGALEVRVEANGELVARTRGGGEVRQHRPLVYQETGDGRRELAGRYVMAGRNEVGFEVDDYDRSRPLVIDPVLVYSSYLGGNNFDSGNAIAVDSQGNAYVTGQAGSRNFPVTAGAFQRAKGNAATSAFVTKINPAGTAVVYSTYLRGEGENALGYVTGYGIAVDAQGNAYVTGEASTVGFPTTPGAPDDSPYGWDAFITKLNPQGSGLVYSTLLGGSFDDFGRDIAVDAQGNAYVTGYTVCQAPTCDFPAVEAFQPRHGGGYQDAFVTKLNAQGTAYVYSTHLGGGSQLNAGDDWGDAVAVDAQGSAYVAGYTYSPDFPVTAGAYDRTRNGLDAFVTKLAPDGRSLVYSTFLGGDGREQALDIALDPDGNAYVAGLTESYNFPATAGAFQTAGGFDAFVTKLNPAGSALVYSTYLGGAGGEDRAWGIALDAGRNAYVAGDTRSGDFPVVAAAQPSYGGGLVEGFVSKLNASGTALAYSTFIGGDDFDEARGVAIDGSGNAYVTGYTTSRNFVVTVGAFQTTPGGTDPNDWPHPEDAFIVKLAEGSATPAPTITPTPTPTPSNNPPTAAVTSPAHNSTFDTNTDVTITAEASDGDGAVSRVNFWADGSLIGSDTTAPYSVTFRDSVENTRSFWVTAVDDDGAHGANSPAVTVNFVDPNPTLYITGRVLHELSSPEKAIPVAGVTMTVTRFKTGAVVRTAVTDADGYYSVGPLSQGAALDLTASRSGYTMLPPSARWDGLPPGATQDFEARGPLPPGTSPGDPNAPPAAWAASFNGPANDVDAAARVAADNQGNVYVTGASNNAPGETADKDIVTVKYGPDGSQLWARRFDGPGGYIDAPTAVAVGAGGTVYVAGYSWSGANDYDYVLIKYLNDGTQVWAKYYDGPVHRGDQATSLKLDGAGNAYVTGYSTGGAVGARVNFGYATVKYDVNGERLWARRFEGHNQCGAGAEDLELDGAGGVYVTGSVTPGDCGGEKNIYTIKYDGGGNQLWAAEFDSPQGVAGVDLDTALGLSVDRQGRACVFGFNWPGDRRRDFLLLKYDAAGGLLWSRNWSGPDDDIAREIAVDAAGNIYATGDSLEPDSASQNAQAVTVKYGPDGTLLWERAYGTAGRWDGDNRMVMDGAGNVFVALQSQTGADYDFTTIKYAPDGSRLWVHRLAGFLNDLVG